MSPRAKIKRFLAEANSPDNLATCRDKLERALELLAEAAEQFPPDLDMDALLAELHRRPDDQL